MSSSNDPPSLVILRNDRRIWFLSSSLFFHPDWRNLQERFVATEAPAMTTGHSNNVTASKPERRLVKRKNRPPRASAPPIKTPYSRPDTKMGGEGNDGGATPKIEPKDPSSERTLQFLPLPIPRSFPLRGSILPYTRQGKAQARRNVSTIVRSKILDIKVRENQTIAAFVRDMSFTKMMGNDEKLGEALAAMVKGKSGHLLVRDQIEELEERMKMVEIVRERMFKKSKAMGRLYEV